MQTVCGFQLENRGGFVCAGEVMYIKPDGGTGKSDRWHYISLGQDEMMYPNEKGVEGGSFIQIYIDIVAGNDRTGGLYFLYDPSAPQYARYKITGTTFDSGVHFEGLINN